MSWAPPCPLGLASSTVGCDEISRQGMARKTTHPTAERILDVALDLLNRFGLPNVSTALIAAEMKISAGNLYYHYPSKDELINRLFDRYRRELTPLQQASVDVHDLEGAWFFLHSGFELIWHYRFLYRDPSHLLSNNRYLEQQFQIVQRGQTEALACILRNLCLNRVLRMDAHQQGLTATCLSVVLTYWLDHEYVLDPRHAFEPEQAQQSVLRGAEHMLGLLAPFLEDEPRRHWERLSSAYHT